MAFVYLILAQVKHYEMCFTENVYIGKIDF